MGNRAFWWRSVALLGLLGGVAGCEDRLRPVFGGLGNGIGPVFTITAPAEMDTVYRDTTFTIALTVEDEDGIDSVWVTVSDSLQGLSFDGTGQGLVFVSFTPFVPSFFVPDTITITVQGVDSWGDSGVVVQRRVLVQ